MSATQRGNAWLLWAILLIGATAIYFIPSGGQHESQISQPSMQSSRGLNDSLYEAIINELLEGWGKCEMEKPGHIVYPSDTAVKII